MPEKVLKRPRLITFLMVLLLLQAPLLLFLGLNLLTKHWDFLLSWSVFWTDLKESISLVQTTPGILVEDEILFYDLLAYAILLFGAVGSFVAGLAFHRGKPFVWMMSLLAQIVTLGCGIGLYFIHAPTQAYWLMAYGILMVLYLNYSDVRQWFLQSKKFHNDGDHV